MGRGQGNSDKALRLRAIPRRLARPKFAGQRRYFIHQASLDRNLPDLREPGYLRIAAQRDDNSGPREYMTIQEEIAVLGPDGKLDWISANNRKPLSEVHIFHSGGGLAGQRVFADELNRTPLGPYLDREVDKNGNIVIRRGNRHLSTKSYSPQEIEAGVEVQQSFAVNQAAQAKAYYQQQQELYQKDVEAEIARAIAALPAYERDGYFENEAAAELGQRSQQLADSL